MPVSTEERRIVTVLFADLAGSTALGEQLDPEEMRRLLARYYKLARETVVQYGGTVEKFIGDAVMAVFGLPAAHGDDPDRAVAAALAIRDRIRSDPELASRLTVRFGVSTGEVVASRDQSAGDFLITGDATNVAARLQQAADPWAVLVSDRTVRAAAAFEFGDEIDVEAKGKSAPVVARPALGPRKPKARRRVRLPLVGRENDLAQLQLVARRAVIEKRPSMVSVIAPAGTGKTRLVEEFIDWLPGLAPNAVVATAQCLPYGQQLTYWPMRQVLFTLTGYTEGAVPPNMSEELAAWLHGLGVQEADRDAKLLARTVGEKGAEGADRDLLFTAWRTTLEAVSRHTPLVIVFEDLHWSSDSLLDLAEFVMQPRGEAAVLMLVLARPELLDRRPNWGGGRLNHLAISLEPLGATAIGDLVRHLLDTEQPDVVKLVSERSEGNPFFAGELVRSYMEQGSLERLPDTVQATVLARLDLLPAEQRRVLQLGSVFGRAFRAGGVGALEPALANTGTELCEELADRDLVRPGEGDVYSFRHILIQEVAYGTLPRSERARLHGAAARWVESLMGDHEESVAEILAFHYREAAVLWHALDPHSVIAATDAEAAGKWLLKAATEAIAAGATPEAVRHMRAAFDFVEPSMLPRLHERIGDLTAGDYGLEEYRVALDLYTQSGASIDLRLSALSGIVMVATRWQGSVGDRMSAEEMAALREQGRALLAEASDPRSIGRFEAADAFFPFWIQGLRAPTPEETAQAEASANRAIQIATEKDYPELASAALDALGGIASTVADWPRALGTARRRIEFEDRLGLYERLDAHSMVAWMSYLIGDLRTADKDSGDMIARLLPGQAPYPALHLLAWRALTLLQLGRWDEAVAVFYRAVEAWHDAGSHAAGYALRGFVAGLDIGRARNDARIMNAASDAIMSILGRFPSEHGNMQLAPYVTGVVDFTSVGAQAHMNPLEALERRLALAADLRAPIPDEVLQQQLQRSLDQKVLLLEAQLRRCMALAHHDTAEMTAAIEIWERVGALPNLARAHAERGVLTRDPAETEEGLKALKKIGDMNYVDRFTAIF